MNIHSCLRVQNQKLVLRSVLLLSWWSTYERARERKLEEGYFRQKIVSLWSRNLLHWAFQFHCESQCLKINQTTVSFYFTASKAKILN